MKRQIDTARALLRLLRTAKSLVAQAAVSPDHVGGETYNAPLSVDTRSHTFSNELQLSDKGAHPRCHRLSV